MSKHNKRTLQEALARHPGKIQVPLFPGYMRPNGYLLPDRPCHGLFYYYLSAQRVYEQNVEVKRIVYEGDPDPIVVFRNLFTSISALYGVSGEMMSKYWECVDAQCDLMGFPLLPDEEKYRFNSPIILLN